MDIRKHITPIVFLLHLPLLAFVLAIFHKSFMSLDISALVFIGITSLIMGITMSVVHWILTLAMDELFPNQETEIAAVSEQSPHVVWMETYVLQPTTTSISFQPNRKRAYLTYYGV